MANSKTSQNLKNINDMSKEKAKEFHSKGGKASAIAKRKRKAFKETLELIVDKNIPDDFVELKAFLNRLGIDETEQNMQLAMSVSMIQKAISGDTRAYEVVRDTLGQKPIEKQEIKEFKSEWFKE